MAFGNRQWLRIHHTKPSSIVVGLYKLMTQGRGVHCVFWRGDVCMVALGPNQLAALIATFFSPMILAARLLHSRFRLVLVKSEMIYCVFFS